MYTAIKPVYNRSTKTYTIQVIENAQPIMAHEGFLVYDNASRALGDIIRGRLLQSWHQDKKDAIVHYLTFDAK